jgi:RNA polymerase sigma-70 factor (ECF subfamily)
VSRTAQLLDEVLRAWKPIDHAQTIYRKDVALSNLREDIMCVIERSGRSRFKLKPVSPYVEQSCMCQGSPITSVSVDRVRNFATTHWSLVLAAGDAKSSQAKEYLEKLCRTYWYPLYAYVRRKGYQPDDARDLTQEFFARLLARNYLSVADRNRGKFRSFLLASLEHFLAREWTKARAQKRGGGKAVGSLDMMDAEDHYLLEPSHELTAEKIFDRRWATTLLDQAMSQLRRECMDSGKGELFAKVEGSLSGQPSDATYAEIAVALDKSEGAIKVAVHRLRQRYGELVRAELAQTVAAPEEADEELKYLFAVLRS